MTRESKDPHICSLINFPKPPLNSTRPFHHKWYRHNISHNIPGKTSHSPSQPFIYAGNLSGSPPEPRKPEPRT